MSLRREVDLLFCAIQFLTRFPTPRLAGFTSDWITRSARYFPLVGQMVGVVCAAVWWICGRWWPGLPAAVLAVGAGLLATGGFHEDGLADTADGLGGGQTREARLSIMKDSRLGSFGALALGAVCLLKVALLSRMGSTAGAWALVAVNGAGRSAAVVVMASLPYAGDPERAKSKPSPRGVTVGEALVAVCLGFWPFIVFSGSAAALALALGGAAVAAMALTTRQLIGGVTGDVLGAVEQLAEIGILMGLTA